MLKYIAYGILIFAVAEVMVIHLRFNRCVAYAAGIVQVFEHQKK